MSLVQVNQSRAMTKRRRKRGRKPMRKRRYRGSLVPASVNRVYLGGFPDSVKVKLRYCQVIRLDPTLTADQHLFRCIAPQNPSYTSIVDHQPQYYDQWSNIYTHYTVLGAKCRMTYLPAATSTTNALTGFFGIYTCTDNNGINVFSDDIGVLEANNSTNMRIAGTLTGSNHTPARNSYAETKFSTRKFFGIKDPQDGNAYSSLTNGIPNQEAYWACYYSSIGTNDPSAQQFLITIDYIIEFRDRRPVDIS